MGSIPYIFLNLGISAELAFHRFLPFCCAPGKRSGLKAAKASSHLFLQGCQSLEKHHLTVENTQKEISKTCLVV